MPETPTSKTRSLRLVLALLALVLVAAGAASWLNRKALAREALTGWLRARGVASEAQVEAIGPTSFVARLRIGDPARPDFTAERMDVRYRPRLFGIEVISVTLRKPVLRANLHAGRLTLGALDPLIADFLRHPPPPGTPTPRVLIESGVASLTTDFGPVTIVGDLVSDEGKLTRLDALTRPMVLKGRDFQARLGAARVRADRNGERLNLNLSAPVERIRAGRFTSVGGLLQASLLAPYPNFTARRADGPLTLRSTYVAKRLSAADPDVVSDVRLVATFDGQTKGRISTLDVLGRASLSATAAAANLASSRTGALNGRATSEALHWTRTGGDRLTGLLALEAAADDLIASDLTLTDAQAQFTGPLNATRQRIDLSLTGGLRGRGAWRGLGPATAADVGQMAAIKRAAQGFRFAAPDVRMDATGRFRLAQPLGLHPDAGGEVRLAWNGSAARLTVGGGGLPDLDARLDHVVMGTVASANVALKARASLGPLQGGEIDAAGRLGMADGDITFAAERCAAVRAARLDFDANDIEGLSGRFCSDTGPMLTLSPAGWRLRGRLESAQAGVPFLQARVESAGGRVSASGQAGDVRVEAAVTSARLLDVAPDRRFNPLLVSGPATLDRGVWRADLSLRPSGGADVANVKLTHDGRLGTGAAVIETLALRFSEGGLQPDQLSPLVGAVGSPVVGEAQFSGRFDWSSAGATSQGTLTVPGLDFTSSAGRVRGLKGQVAFTSLAPLAAAPGQALEIDEVQALVPLTRLRAKFSLLDNLLKIEGGEAEVGGGRVLIEQLEPPMAAGAGPKGALIFEGVQLHDLVEASPFGDRVDLDAKVSGRVPFAVVDGRMRILGGELKAIEPGRLSIQRAALTGVQADGALKTEGKAPDPAASTDTFTAFAYQAMEHLAFETLDATLKSRDNGRLGVLFHIVGRHDPPTKQQIRLSLTDLIRKRYMERKLPLPSGTGVNLTIDTTLNLDDLLSDYAEFRKTRGSDAVQP